MPTSDSPCAKPPLLEKGSAIAAVATPVTHVMALPYLCCALLPAVYSMVKFGGVRNYIVGTWNATDLAACADLNLPCADITSMLPEPMDNEPNGIGGSLSQHDYLVSRSSAGTHRCSTMHN